MAQLSREEFDAIEFAAARTGDHRGAAERMTRLAAAAASVSEMCSAEAYLRAGEQWLLADDPAAAADSFRRALEDGGGRSSDDATVSLARALFQLGRADEATGLIKQLEAGGRRDPRQCDLVAELLVEQSDLIGALDWANTGVELCLAEGARPGQGGGTDEPLNGLAADAAASPPGPISSAVDQTELRLLLSLRYRIRNDMGLDEDDYDRLLDQL